MTTAVIGNAAVATTVNNDVETLYVFNNLRNLGRIVFVHCPQRIVHVWNRISKSAVENVHETLRSLCPNANMTLRTNGGMHVHRISEYGFPAVVRHCFSSVAERMKRTDGHPWSLGFYVLASLVAQNVTPLVISGFTHHAWSGHPMRCERMAVDFWKQSGTLDKLPAV